MSISAEDIRWVARGRRMCGEVQVIGGRWLRWMAILDLRDERAVARVKDNALRLFNEQVALDNKHRP